MTLARRADELPANLRAALLRWLDDLSPHTRKAYTDALWIFAKWLRAQGLLKSLPDDREAAVEAAGVYLLSLGPVEASATAAAWLQSLLQPGDDGVPSVTRGTAQNRLSALRWAVRQAHQVGLVTWQLQAGLPRPQKDKAGRVALKPGRDMRGPTPEEAARMLEVVQEDPVARFVLSAILHETLREHEIRQLDVADVDLEAQVVQVVRKKRVEPEPVPLSRPTGEALRGLLEVRGAEPGPLLLNPQGSRVSRAYIPRLVARAALEAGVERQVSPHRLRHTAITMGDAAAEALGLSAKVRQHRAGHRGDRSYARYVDDLAHNARTLSDAVARALADLSSQ